MPSQSDTEEQYRRHEEREFDRKQQRLRERQCLPLADWTHEERLDLEHSVTAEPPIGHTRPIRPPRHQTFQPRQVNPFFPTDSLNRPSQKHRKTTALSKAQVTHLHEIVLRANCMGLVMNVFVTIAWERAGIDEANIAAAQARLMRRVREWAKGRTFQGKRLDALIGWIWVHESGPTVGVHTHYLFCCPPQERTALWRVIQRSLASAGSTAQQTGAMSHLPLDASALDFSDRPEQTGLKADMRQQWTLFGYVTKTKTISYTPKPSSFGKTGEIIGKRAGFSHHLLGSTPWKRFVVNRGRHVTWMKDFLKNASRPYPLVCGAYAAEYQAYRAEPATEPAGHSSGPTADAYPKTASESELGLRRLRV
ncbi:hypothetical protein [Brevundimonas sp.]|uniref:hypothetical protein n=1 Tax=Brevundimonas sp. TaxID=1871086 RepID=UPI002E15D588